MAKLKTGTTVGGVEVVVTTDSRLSDARTPTAHTHPVSEISDLTATAAELNTLDGITASTAELNLLDGVTASTAELNYVDGVTSSIQTQLNSKASSSHTHGNISNTGAIGTTSGLVVTTTTSGVLTTSSRSGIDSRASFPPSSHTHGNITNDGKVGTTSDQVLVTTTDGVVTTASRSGIDSRSTFPPSSHTHTFASLTSKPTTLSGYGITDADTSSEVDTKISTAVSNLVNGADAAYDTLKEIQDAMATDAELSAAIAGLTIGNGTQTITAGSGLSGGGSFTANQTGNTSVTINHADTSSQTSVDNSGFTYIQDVTLDTYGHITALGSATWSHPDTSSQASVDNSNGTVIQDISLDGAGHVTSIGSVNLDGRYYTETEADSRFVNVTGDTMTGALDFNTVTGRVITITADGTLDSADASIYLGNAVNSYGFDITYEGTGSGNANALVITSTNAGSPKELLRSNQDGIVNLPQSGAKVAGNTIFHDGYHPNADVWTTARTLTIGDTGKSVNGSANVSWSLAEIGAYAATNPSGFTTNTGTVTSVATGTGLTGGTITTSGTISHADTSTQASVDNSNGTVIQDVTLDDFGHITALGSVNLDGRYYTESEVDTLLAGKQPVGSYDNYGSWTLQAQDSSGTSLGSSTITSGDTAIIKAGSNVTLSWADDTVTIASSFTNNYLTGVSGSGDGTVTFTRQGLGNLTWDASHSHSEYLTTSGKAADSDLLDGIDSGSFLRSDAADTSTEKIIFNGGLEVLSGTGGGAFRIKRNSASTTGDDITDIHMDDGSIYFDIDNDNDGDQGDFRFRKKADGVFVEPFMYANTSRIFTDGYHPNADTLTTARNIALTGDVTGNANFDGSANISITATVADDSHNHVISNVDGLQTALDGKLSTSGKAADSELLDGLDSTAFLRSNANDSASGIISLTNTTDSTSVSTGALVVSGGVGIAKNLYVGGDVDLAGKLTVAENATFNGSIDIAEDLSIGGFLNVAGDATFGGSIDIADNLSVGGYLNVAGDATFGGSIDIAEDVNVGGSLRVQESIEANSIDSAASAIRDNKLFLRYGATTAMGDNEFAGLVAVNADGLNDAALLFDGNNKAKVGDINAWLPFDTAATSLENISVNDLQSLYVFGRATSFDGSNVLLYGFDPTNDIPTGKTAFYYDFTGGNWYEYDTTLSGPTRSRWTPISSFGTPSEATLQSDDAFNHFVCAAFYEKYDGDSTTRYILKTTPSLTPPYRLYSGNLYEYNSTTKLWYLSIPSLATTEPSYVALNGNLILTPTNGSRIISASTTSSLDIRDNFIIKIPNSGPYADYAGNWIIYDWTSGSPNTFKFLFNKEATSSTAISNDGSNVEILKTAFNDTSVSATTVRIFKLDNTSDIVVRPDSSEMTDRGLVYWNDSSNIKRIETSDQFYISNTGGLIANAGAGIRFKDYDGVSYLNLVSDNITASRVVILPDATGTLALTSDIPTNNNELTNGAGYITDYTVTKSDVDTALGTAAANDSYFYRGDGTWAAVAGDISSVTAGTGLSGGGTSGDVTLSLASGVITAGTYGSTADGTKVDQITVDTYGRVTAITTGAVGDILGVTAGTGLSGGGTSGTVTLDLDFSELTDMTADISGTTEFILQNGTTESRKAASEIKLSAFNNDAGWTSNTGTVSSLADLGITATATELNKMDGVTATTTEINYIDGVTSSIQTQLNGKQDDLGTGSTNQFLRWGALGSPFWDTVTASDVGAASSTHSHGSISSTGTISSSVEIASGDHFLISDDSASGVIRNSSITFGTSTTQFLANNGTWQTPASGSSDPQGGFFSTDAGLTGLTSNGWTNGYDSTVSWSGTSGTTTPSTGTGPTSDTSVSGFIFIEASSNTNTSHKIAIDLSASLPRQLKFKYHMYGAVMGTLNIIADTTTLFTLSGDQGDVWVEQVVDLPEEAHTLIIEGISGASSFTSDICIADIEIIAETNPFKKVKDWAGTLTVSGATTTANVTEDLLGKIIAIEVTDTSGASDETSLVFVRLNTNTTYANFVHNLAGGSNNIVYTSYFGVARTSATQLTFYQPRWTYESFSTGSPSAPSSNISDETLYVHNIFVVEDGLV